MTRTPHPSRPFGPALAGLGAMRGLVVGALVSALVLFGLLPALHAISHGSGPSHPSVALALDAHASHACTNHGSPTALPTASPTASRGAEHSEPARPTDSSCHTCVELLLASALTSPGLPIDWSAPALEATGLAPTDLAGIMTAREIALAHARGPPTC